MKSRGVFGKFAGGGQQMEAQVGDVEHLQSAGKTE